MHCEAEGSRPGAAFLPGPSRTAARNTDPVSLLPPFLHPSPRRSILSIPQILNPHRDVEMACPLAYVVSRSIRSFIRSVINKYSRSLVRAFPSLLSLCVWRERVRPGVGGEEGDGGGALPRRGSASFPLGFGEQQVCLCHPEFTDHFFADGIPISLWQTTPPLTLCSRKRGLNSWPQKWGP